jgi:DNA-binding transcriptional regulator YiaG
MEWFDEMRRLRESMDLSQEELAPLLNVRVRTYARWEKGEPKKPKLLELQKLRDMARSKKKRGA